jgi:hypothetical protein
MQAQRSMGCQEVQPMFLLTVLQIYSYIWSSASRLRSGCKWFHELACNGLPDPEFMPYSDEAWFSLSGYVNSQNNRYWSIENPHALSDVSLHDLRVGDWCAISAQKITRFMLFHKENTEHSETFCNSPSSINT